MAKYRKRREWERLVAQYRSSGLSQREFAVRRGLSISSLGRWSRQLLVDEGREVAPPAPVGLTEIVAKRAVSRMDVHQERGGLLRLRVGPAVCLELPELPSPEYVALVARAYEAVAP